MKLGIFGGSFNPVHDGHLYIAKVAAEKLELDRIIFIPAYQSPFKAEKKEKVLSSGERINRLACAIAGDPRFSIDDCEIKREGISYTVHTLEDIITRYLPSGKPYLIIGDDVAGDFTEWREYKKILSMAEIVIARRIDKNGERQYPYPHIKLGNEIINISSSMIRNGTKPSSAPCEPSVWHLCENTSSFVLEIEKEARKTLSTARFLHSRHTALLAFDMCRRLQNDNCNINPMDGYLAGVAHDLAKQYEPKEMLKLAKKDGLPVSVLEKDKPNLLHGRAAAVLLRDKFSIQNIDVLEAVRVHTSGSPDMRPLARIIYIADKVEVSRNTDNPKTLDDLVLLRKMCYEIDGKSEVSLNNVLYNVLIRTVSKLKSRGLDVSEDTLKLLEKMAESSKLRKNI